MLADVAAAKFVELCAALLPAGTDVFAGPPAGDQPLDQCVWVDSDESEYDWRALGVHPGNRAEAIVLNVVIAVYREAETHLAAQAAARAKATEIERAIEEHVLGDSCDLDGTVTDALVQEAKRSYIAANDGWSRRAELKIVARNHPG